MIIFRCVVSTCMHLYCQHILDVIFLGVPGSFTPNNSFIFSSAIEAHSCLFYLQTETAFLTVSQTTTPSSGLSVKRVTDTLADECWR